MSTISDVKLAHVNGINIINTWANAELVKIDTGNVHGVDTPDQKETAKAAIRNEATRRVGEKNALAARIEAQLQLLASP